MGKTFIEQAQELQTTIDELEIQLKSYEKAVDSLLKTRFSKTSKEIEKLIKNQEKSSSSENEFEKEIYEYFSLYSSDEKKIFLDIICRSATYDYYIKCKRKREENINVADS